MSLAFDVERIERRLDQLEARLDDMVHQHIERQREATEDIARLRRALRGMRNAIIREIDELEEADQEEVEDAA
jgi:hypothetical protein